MGGRRAYVERMEGTLRDWNALFEALGREVGGQRTRARTRYARVAESFRPRREAAEQELARLRDAGQAWKGARDDVERAVDKLRDLLTTVKIT